MSYIHIVTVGASLASNYERDKARASISEVDIEEKLTKITEAERTQYGKELLRYVQDKEAAGELAKVSAELNGLSRYFKEISMVYLIHTDTNLGKCCAEALRSFLLTKDKQVPEPIEIEGLHSQETFQKGLSNLIKKVAHLLAQHRKVRVCATGGFKPEVALASVLGFIAKVPVYYIHESFRQEVHLPALPIDWKYKMKNFEKLVKALVSAGDKGIEKEQFLKNFGAKARDELLNDWLIEEKGNRYVASEISQAILEAIQTLHATR